MPASFFFVGCLRLQNWLFLCSSEWSVQKQALFYNKWLNPRTVNFRMTLSGFPNRAAHKCHVPFLLNRMEDGHFHFYTKSRHLCTVSEFSFHFGQTLTSNQPSMLCDYSFRNTQNNQGMFPVFQKTQHFLP